MEYHNTAVEVMLIINADWLKRPFSVATALSHSDHCHRVL